MKTTILQQDPPLILKALEHLPGGVTIWAGEVGTWRLNCIPAGSIVVDLSMHPLEQDPAIKTRYAIAPYDLRCRSDGIIYEHYEEGNSPFFECPIVGITAHSTPLDSPIVASVLTAGVVDARHLLAEPPADIIKRMPRIHFLHLGVRGERIYPYTE